MTQPRNKYISAIFIALMGALLFSSKAVLIKAAYLFDVDKLSLLLLRMGFALPFYIFFAFNSKNSTTPQSTTKKDWIILIGLGIIGYYFASYLDLWGLQYITAGMERLILFIYPTLTTILVAIFFKRKITPTIFLSILLTYLGIVVAFWEFLFQSELTNFWLGALLIFGSALTFSFYLVGSERLIPKFGSIKFTSYSMIVSCLATILHFSLQNENDILGFQWQVYAIALCISVFCTVLPSFMMSYAIKQIGASKTAILSSVGPIWVLLFAYLALNEEFSTLQLTGTLIVIGGVWLTTQRK